MNDHAAPDHAAPDHAAPDHADPGHVTPDHATLDRLVSSRRPLWLGLAAVGAIGVITIAAIVLDQGGPAPEPATPPAAQAQPPPTAKPVFDIVRVGPQGGAVIAGRAAPGAEVVIEDAGKEIGRTTADAHGDWVFTSDTALPSGPQALTLTARNPDGEEIKGAGTVFLAVPAPPANSQVATTRPETSVAVLTDPNAPPRMLQDAAPAHLGLGAVDYDERGALRFAGSAPPNTSVRVYVDNKPVGDATADGSGHWTLSPQAPVTAGPHRLRLDQLDGRGRVAARAELPFTRVPPGSTRLAEGNIIVEPGQSLWQMAMRAYGNGTRYTVIYQANRGQIRDPNLIYPGQLFAVPGDAATSVTPPSSSRSR
jgi:Bacterial Ig-like domain/LysM domain